MLEHFDVSDFAFLNPAIPHQGQVNVNGTLVLFQATYPLLKASTSTPKFIAVSSAAGCITIGSTMPMKAVAYGASKAALNYVVRKLQQENKELGT
jgi:NAD(P)-dependent dehydrogenase (short-subunit alcohol dehydrogenase family)